MRDADNFIDGVTKHWAVILFILGMAMTWGVYSTKMQGLDSRITNLEANNKEMQIAISAIQGDVREIKTTLLFIKERLN